LTSSSFQIEEKKNTNKKKNHRKGKKLREGRELTSFQIEEKKNTKKKNAKKGESLPFFFRFYIRDEALLLLSPLHIP
jgi:hypothetical protein